MITIDARGMDVQNWTSQSAFFLTPYGIPPKLTDPDKWMDWASAVINFPAVAGLGAPDPGGFSDWRDWATRFNRVVAMLET